jgi:hypothetical protein
MTRNKAQRPALLNSNEAFNFRTRQTFTVWSIGKFSKDSLLYGVSCACLGLLIGNYNKARISYKGKAEYFDLNLSANSGPLNPKPKK